MVDVKQSETLRKLVDIESSLVGFILKLPVDDVLETKEICEKKNIQFPLDIESDLVRSLFISPNNKEALLRNYKYLTWKNIKRKDMQELLIDRFNSITIEESYGDPLWTKMRDDFYKTENNASKITYQFNCDLWDHKINAIKEDMYMEDIPELKQVLTDLLLTMVISDRTKNDHILKGITPRDNEGFSRCVNCYQNEDYVRELYQANAENVITTAINTCINIHDDNLDEDNIYQFYSSRYDLAAALRMIDATKYDLLVERFHNGLYKTDEGKHLLDASSYTVNDINCLLYDEKERIHTEAKSTKEFLKVYEKKARI